MYSRKALPNEQEYARAASPGQPCKERARPEISPVVTRQEVPVINQRQSNMKCVIIYQ